MSPPTGPDGPGASIPDAEPGTDAGAAPGASPSTELDLGGRGGCGLGCALTCGQQPAARDHEARCVLAATGAALVLLAVIPGLVSGGWALPPAATTGALGMMIAVLAVGAIRAGRPGSDGRARWAHRLVPAGMVGLLVTWTLALVGALLA